MRHRSLRLGGAGASGAFVSFTFAALVACLTLALPALAQEDPYYNFEAGHVRPLALSPNGQLLFAVNTPDGTLEIFDVLGNGNLEWAGAVQVGLEPVAVAARTNDEVWVVNHLSDSVSIVDLSGVKPRVVRTLLVGDEPRDIVFAGSSGDRAFITTAHRGQNTGNPDGDFDVEGIGRADIWAFHATALGSSLEGDPLSVITVFADKPRALAVSNDGSRVYAAAFRSGNQTMALSAGFMCETNQSNLDNDIVQPACTIEGQSVPGGTPPPHNNTQGSNRPGTGLIVKKNRDGLSPNEWQDELDRDWSNMVRFNLPDRDVFEINADASPPAAVDGSSTCANNAGCWAHVGTTLFNMAVHPTSGRIYVSNTDSQNHVRFEGPGLLADGIKPMNEPAAVTGNLAQARITVLDGANVNARHLNNHINYNAVPSADGIKNDSLATPLGMAFDSTGSTLYVAAFGSQKIGVIDTADLEADNFTPDENDHIVLSGGGPSGLVVSGDRIYVMTRFNNSISVVDRVEQSELTSVSLHNPEPPSIVDGRPFLYDANFTSSNGEASCSSCHIFGDNDDLGWDLGNPDDNVKTNSNGFNDQPFIDNLFGLTSCQIQGLAFSGTSCNFHPMKGPMTTQSLRGLENQGPQHWRGDRGDPGAGGQTADTSFNNFNVAFPGLVGRDDELTTEDMQAFTDFALQLRYPPNPIRNLDNSLTNDQNQGVTALNKDLTDGVASCVGCHTHDASLGFFGGTNLSTFDAETQVFKVPHFRNLYQKVGMFGEAEPAPIIFPAGLGEGTAFTGPFDHTGDQIRGFGFAHDGAVDTASRFLSAGVFNVNNAERADLERLVLAFDTDLAPIVGQQVTLTSTNGGTVGSRIQLLIDRADTNWVSKVVTDQVGGAANECDLMAKLIDGGLHRGYLYRPSPDDDFLPDNGDPAISDGALRGKAATSEQEITYTCLPPGTGFRVAMDRDGDGLLNGVETATGVFVGASNTGSRPDKADTDNDGWDDPAEVAAGTDPSNPLDFPGAPPVPLLSPLGVAALVALMVTVGGAVTRRQRNLA